MVKNSGGCRTKGLARKLVNAPVSDRVRKIEEEGECYAIVSKMLGNGMCHVNILQDDNILPNIVCHIRGKFRGRNKKANFVSVGTFVIVGLRTWEHTINACDLVFIINQPNSLHLSPILFNSIYSINHTIDSNSDIVEFSNISHSTTTSTLPTPSLIINDHIDFNDI